MKILSARPAFTLLELMVTIAITGFLTTILFSTFSLEKNRNFIKSSVRTLQNDFQAMQTNAQSGVLTGAVVPAGYGVYVPNAGTTGTLGTTYIIFADTDNSGTRNSNTLEDIRTVTFTTASGVRISKISGAYTQLDTVYSTPNGTALITGLTIPVHPTSATLYLKRTKPDVCYAVTITAGVGTISQKKLTNFASC